MLDFFLIQDDQNLSSRGLALERVGGIEDDLFFQLQAGGIIEPWFDYYGKFRWGSEIVARMLLKLQQQPVAVSRREQRIDFMAILQKAVDKRTGIVALGD
jgi:hypothetical protein